MWVHGKHTLTFGGGFRRQQWNNQNNSNPRGSFGFNGAPTSQYVNGQPVTGNRFGPGRFSCSACRYGRRAVLRRGNDEPVQRRPIVLFPG